jgi:ectoine hydroxylase-related dioxygenase (phytanoyl-CoA dioxygenase family)
MKSSNHGTEERQDTARIETDSDNPDPSSALTDEQRAFFHANGYLPYGRVLSDDELHGLRERSEDIACGRMDHVPPRYIQLEAAFRDANDATAPRLDRVRKMTHLSYFDGLFEATARKAAIVDVIEALMGPNIKMYCDQLMMKPRHHGTVTNWHQDSVAWPQFAPQNHISCWVALDDATIDNGCMTVLPGSHKWGPISRDQQDSFLNLPVFTDPVAVELKAGHCMFHHGLNFHRTGANKTPHRRRGLAIHYLSSETMYLGMANEEKRLTTECEKPGGEFRFMLIRGKEFPGRV